VTVRARRGRFRPTGLALIDRLLNRAEIAETGLARAAVILELLVVVSEGSGTK
jgi:hypothetical protein